MREDNIIGDDITQGHVSPNGDKPVNGDNHAIDQGSALASDSNAVADYPFSHDGIPGMGEVEGAAEVSVGDYERTVIDRLDTIAVSAIISTCVLFLLLLRSRK